MIREWLIEEDLAWSYGWALLTLQYCKYDVNQETITCRMYALPPVELSMHDSRKPHNLNF
jgi:hypothetical protein